MAITAEQWEEFTAYIEDSLQRNPKGSEIDALELRDRFGFAPGFYGKLLEMAREEHPPFSIRKGYGGESHADDFTIVFEKRA